MSLKQTILGLCVSALALVGTVTTVSAAGGDLGLGSRPVATSTSSTVRVAAATPSAALRMPAAARGFGDAPAAMAQEEALPASSLGVLALATLMLVGLLMTRRSGRN